MKQFSAIAALMLSVGMYGQTIQNGDFESWSAQVIPTPQYYYFNSNQQAIMMGLNPNALQVTDAQQGTFAVQLNTVSTPTDTLFGFIANGDPGSGTGGIPYNQSPTALTGYYKSNVPAGDTAILIAFFKSGGTVISIAIQSFTGVHSVYTPFTLPIVIPSMLTPDSVIIGAASSNAFVNQGIPGSMLQIDNLLFTGVSSQPAQMNGSFENWQNQNMHRPNGWAAGGDTAYRSTDAHGGSYALQLTTIQYDASNAGPSVANIGNVLFNGGGAGRPYALTSDTLCFWYKFLPVGVDSGVVWIQTKLAGNPVGGMIDALPPASSYTYKEIPFTSGLAPDSLMLIFASTFNNTLISNAGSRLLVDDVYLKSSPLSVRDTWAAFSLLQLQPNPASDLTMLSWNSRFHEPVTVRITDVQGKEIYTEQLSGDGPQQLKVNTAGFESGIYLVTIRNSHGYSTQKLVVRN